MKEKLYVKQGKKLNIIYFFNIKNKYFKLLKRNFYQHKLHIQNYQYNIEVQKNKIIIQKSLEKKSNLSKAYKFLNKAHNNYDKHKVYNIYNTYKTYNTYNTYNTSLSNAVTNYFKKKYINL